MSQYDFEDRFGLRFGEAGFVSVPFSAVNTRISFTTPGHTEDRVEIGFPIRDLVFGHRHRMRVWDGDEMLYESGYKFSFFVNLDGAQPDVRDVPHQTMGAVQGANLHLKPSHSYELEILPRLEDEDLGLTLWYRGWDGGEVELLPEAVQIEIDGVQGVWTPLD